MSPTPVRWPLHPPPHPLESLSSWLERLARLYRMPVKQLIATLSPANADNTNRQDWDYRPVPPWLADALVERTGIDPAHLKTMTVTGWAPWLIDPPDATNFKAQESFDTYVRQNPVLLRPGEAGRNHITAWTSWHGPWMPTHKYQQRRCLLCAADPTHPRALVWRLPLVAGCADHGIRLDNAADVERSVALTDHDLELAPGLQRLRPAPLTEPLTTLDHYTYQGLATGQVSLPGRPVHVAVWLRLLRTLLDEVSLAPSTKRSRTKQRLELIWETAGLPPRGGLTSWKPYELMDPPMQDAMLHAAATALNLVAQRKITAAGTLASALAPPPRQPMYEGHKPTPLAVRRSWRRSPRPVPVQTTSVMCADDYEH
ncbi:TniQ family protein [Kribbella sp. NPDC050820]|uniref:TniQ family protein n=1 Tax=Kribbella sp. NPDC050820 TaxID=3155408 RepID=UPI003408BA97